MENLINVAFPLKEGFVCATMNISDFQWPSFRAPHRVHRKYTGIHSISPSCDFFKMFVVPIFISFSSLKKIHKWKLQKIIVEDNKSRRFCTQNRKYFVNSCPKRILFHIYQHLNKLSNNKWVSFIYKKKLFSHLLGTFITSTIDLVFKNDLG